MFFLLPLLLRIPLLLLPPSAHAAAAAAAAGGCGLRGQTWGASLTSSEQKAAADFRCGAAIVSSRFLLTAASCVCRIIECKNGEEIEVRRV